MTRRKALAALLYSSVAARAGTAIELGEFFESGRGAAVLIGVRGRRLIGLHNAAGAGAFLAPPGSTIKPIVLAELIRTGKLGAGESFLCPKRLRIGARAFDCTHPTLDTPMRVDTALAYSCNCFVAWASERFGRGDLHNLLLRRGLSTRTGLLPEGRELTGRVVAAPSPDIAKMQAIGEAGLMITAAELAVAYRDLAHALSSPDMAPVLTGLEGAVDYGTAQLARVEGLKVAGKTGSVRTAAGARIAWFAGYAPSRAPEVAITVMLQGRSGGADAAPVAGRILRAYWAGRL